MKIFFKNPFFDAQLLRALNHVYYSGADVGECMTTAQRIKEGDISSWYQEWYATATRILTIAETCEIAGHLVSAREAYLRAATYFRTAYIFLFGTPVDPRLVQAFDQQTSAFRRAAKLFLPAFEAIRIPYEGTSLPAYFMRAKDDGQPRPTLILTGGYDSTIEELYLFNVEAALRRGYNCICFDGPGQGEMLIKQGLVFRPDWENVVKPVVDFALSRPEVDPARIALMGLSWGGYLAPRAASGEPRLAACIADPGQYDFLTMFKSRMPLPAKFRNQLPDGHPLILMLLRKLMDSMLHHPTKGWVLRRGIWVHGVKTPFDLIRMSAEYTLIGRAAQISCPTLVCEAENDAIAIFAKQLYDALQCPKDYILFTTAEGAGEHCEDGNRSLFHQRAFDWLDKVLSVG